MIDVMVLCLYLYVFSEFFVSLGLEKEGLVMVSEREVSLTYTLM